jgi:uncharacterized circularly permuted ATP-grasp superfamily protein
MVNPLRSYLLGTKALLAMLWEPSFQELLSPAERSAIENAVPLTRILDESTARCLMDERERWVLKKAESHGGRHVILGPVVDDAEWRHCLAEGLTSSAPWIAQRAQTVPRYRLPSADSATGALTLADRYINWNPFLFAGRYAGGITRASDSILINICLGGGLIPTVAVHSSPAWS